MRTLIDIPEEDIGLLTKLSKTSAVSRAELVRRAISQYLETHRRAEKAEAFGLWAHRGEDGLAFQERMRGEWPD
jgi:metal-responsive CopG/Arc/MetJ family transcriptional regulator